MALPSIPQTFALENCRDLLNKLVWEVREFKQESPHDVEALAYRAYNASVTAWQLADWVWLDLTSEQKAEIGVKTLGDLQAKARDECRALYLCRQVATASKHRVVTLYPDPSVDAIVSAAPPIEPRFSSDGTIAVVPPIWRVKFIDGDKHVNAGDVFEHALHYWTELIRRHKIAE